MFETLFTLSHMKLRLFLKNLPHAELKKKNAKKNSLSDALLDEGKDKKISILCRRLISTH